MTLMDIPDALSLRGHFPGNGLEPYGPGVRMERWEVQNPDVHVYSFPRATKGMAVVRQYVKFIYRKSSAPYLCQATSLK